MVLNENDLIKFYELRNRQIDTSPNIGVIGDTKTFKLKIKKALKNMEYDYIYTRNNGNTITVFTGGIETTYIHIETLRDLVGRNFRKYM